MKIPRALARGSVSRTHRLLGLGLLGLAALAAILLAPRPPGDRWTALLGAGDHLARAGGTLALEGRPLTARTAYLLPFHLAQDDADRERMLLVVGRLEALGERDLAAHLGRAAAGLAPPPGLRPD